jgi:hypothetical protein
MKTKAKYYKNMRKRVGDGECSLACTARNPRLVGRTPKCKRLLCEI